jgi:hypothetical protein
MTGMSAAEAWQKYREVRPWTISEGQCLKVLTDLHLAMQDCSGMGVPDRIGMENLYEHLISWTGAGHEMLVVHHGDRTLAAGHVWMWELGRNDALATPMVKAVLSLVGRRGSWVVTDGQVTSVPLESALATARMFQGGQDSPWPPMPWDEGLLLKARLRQIRRERQEYPA